MLTARQITEDIKWLLSDAGLDRHPDFKVTTSRVPHGFKTIVYGVSYELARAALTMYFCTRPSAVSQQREYDGFLTVIQDDTGRGV